MRRREWWSSSSHRLNPRSRLNASACTSCRRLSQENDASSTPHPVASYIQSTTVCFWNIAAGWDQGRHWWLLRIRLQLWMEHWPLNEWTARKVGIKKMTYTLWISTLDYGFITQTASVMNWKLLQQTTNRWHPNTRWPVFFAHSTLAACTSTKNFCLAVCL